MKRRMRRVFGLAMAVLTVMVSSPVLAEKAMERTGSRIPAGLVPTHNSGISVKPAYEYTPGNARYIGEKYTLKGNVSGVTQELNRGSHYYAFSPLYSTYTNPYYGEAYTRVKLPASINRGQDAQGNDLRNGFISLGIFGSLGNYGIDLGIQYTEVGWRPYMYDTFKKIDNNEEDTGYYWFDDKFNVSDDMGATEAIIVATPLSSTMVRFYVQFKDANGNDIYPDDDPFYVTEDIKPNNLSAPNGIPACFYYRFASLVNLNVDVDNQNDGTYMIGGNFNGLALYNTATQQYENWGMSSNLVEKAWKVTPECTTVSWSSDVETFNIRHTGAVPANQ